jgi:hypothetical protein
VPVDQGSHAARSVRNIAACDAPNMAVGWHDGNVPSAYWSGDPGRSTVNR